MRDFPPTVAKLTTHYDAWIVGSAADPGNPGPRDIDVVVPIGFMHLAACLIPASARPNGFGGWKFCEEGVEIDVWSCDLANALNHAKARFAYHPKSGTRWSVSAEQSKGGE